MGNILKLKRRTNFIKLRCQDQSKIANIVYKNVFIIQKKYEAKLFEMLTTQSLQNDKTNIPRPEIVLKWPSKLRPFDTDENKAPKTFT